MQIFRIIFGSISFCMAQEQDKLLAGDQCNRDQCMQDANLAGYLFIDNVTRKDGMSTGCIVRSRSKPNGTDRNGMYPDGKTYAPFLVYWFEPTPGVNEDTLSLFGEKGGEGPARFDYDKEGYFGCSAHHCNATRCEKHAKEHAESTNFHQDEPTPTFQNSGDQREITGIYNIVNDAPTEKFQLGHGCNYLYENQWYWFNGKGVPGTPVYTSACSIVTAQLLSRPVKNPLNFKSVAKVNGKTLETKCRDISDHKNRQDERSYLHKKYICVSNCYPGKARHACCTDQDVFVKFFDEKRTWDKAVVKCGKEGNGGHLCSNKTVLATNQKRLGWTTDTCTIYRE